MIQVPRKVLRRYWIRILPSGGADLARQEKYVKGGNLLAGRVMEGAESAEGGATRQEIFPHGGDDRGIIRTEMVTASSWRS